MHASSLSFSGLRSGLAHTFGLARQVTALLALALPAVLSAQTNGVFTAVTYNVAGLPEGLSSSHPATNTPFIGQRLTNYDYIHVQEDFNYHAALYANDTHPFRTPTSGGAGFGDGLNTLSDFPFTDFQRVTWSQRNGTDALTPKGFTFHRVRLAEGVYVDIYNLHTNAGTATADLNARASNISQLSNFIAANSGGNAVIVMGDTNTRYTRSGDNIRLLTSANGLTDTWIQLIRGGDVPAIGSPAIVAGAVPHDTDEVVDKIFYRSSRLITFTPSAYHLDNAAFYHPTSGLPLSDHWPLFTTFAWRLNAGYRASDLFGGPHGSLFNDIERISRNDQVNTVTIRTGSRVDQVGVTLNTGAVLAHGGSGGTARSLNLAAGEYVSSVRLDAGDYKGHTRIFYVEFHTNFGRTLAGGSTTGSSVTYSAPAGWKITGFYGNQGDAVDKLGVIYTPL